MKIEVGKRYRSGKYEGRVIAVDCNNPNYPVVFMEDDGSIMGFTSSGKAYAGPAWDLQEIPKSYWINIYPLDLQEYSFNSREEADKGAESGRLACIEVKEGDGL